MPTTAEIPLIDAKKWLGIDSSDHQKVKANAAPPKRSRMPGFKERMSSRELHRYKEGLSKSVKKMTKSVRDAASGASDRPDGDPVKSSPSMSSSPANTQGRIQIQQVIDTIIGETSDLDLPS